jgi:hypothetical protein
MSVKKIMNKVINLFQAISKIALKLKSRGLLITPESEKKGRLSLGINFKRLEKVE